MTIVSRRTLLGASAAASMFALAPTSKAAAVSDFVPANVPDGFALFATVTDATSGPTQLSQSIQALLVHGNDLFYGYGDYDKNSGSMTGKGTNLSAINLTTKAQRVVTPSIRTEAILSLRHVGPYVAAPVIDQTTGNQIVALSDGRHSTLLTGPTMEHTFDVVLAGSSLVAVGSGTVDGKSGSLAYEYNWLTRRWNTTPIFSNLTAGNASANYTRFYWTRSLGPYVFAQDGWAGHGNLTRYNVWTKKADLLPALPIIPAGSMAVTTYRGHLAMCNGWMTGTFDTAGRLVGGHTFEDRTVFGFALCEDRGWLYMATTQGIYRTKDVTTWIKVMDTPITYNSNGYRGWFSLAVRNGYVYLGGDHGRIVRSSRRIG